LSQLVGLVVLGCLLCSCARLPQEADLNGRPVLGQREARLGTTSVRPGSGEAERALVAIRKKERSRRACCSATTTAVKPQALAETATRFVGVRKILVKGQRFPFDCSGLARAIYFSQGVDLYHGVKVNKGANGVRFIHRYVRKHGRLYPGPTVSPGDLVFFHNTWDSNGDGHVNDPLTHVGVVVGAEADGTIVFVSRVSRGIERYRMNLANPNVHRTADGRVLNDFMRRKRPSDSQRVHHLTGQLFAEFGTLTS